MYGINDISHTLILVPRISLPRFTRPRSVAEIAEVVVLIDVSATFLSFVLHSYIRIFCFTLYRTLK